MHCSPLVSGRAKEHPAASQLPAPSSSATRNTDTELFTKNGAEKPLHIISHHSRYTIPTDDEDDDDNDMQYNSQQYVSDPIRWKDELSACPVARMRVGNSSGVTT